MALPDPLTTCSDEELLTRFCEGQKEAFGVLVRRYERELYGYLRRYLGDSTLAEDVFQNTFLQLYLKSGKYDPGQPVRQVLARLGDTELADRSGAYQKGRPVRPWLYTIATHLAIDALRRNGRQRAISLDQSRGETTEDELHSLLELVESRQAGPLDLVLDQEIRERVRAAVDRLPDLPRQVLILAYYQGLKYQEIAEILDIPVGTVKSRLHAALIKLQEAWVEMSPLPEL